MAPVAYFVFRRPDHVRRSLEALAANPEAAETDLLVYSDGPRSARDEQGVTEVRTLVAGLTGFKSVELIARERNWGLARSFIGGVTDALQRHERIIVLEDDNLTSPHFLRYMNDALNRYASDERVISISGYVYPARDPLPETFFIRGADSWGWATWRRAWTHFDPDGARLLAELYQRGRKTIRDFDFDDSFCFSCMLEGQVAELNDSWSVRWYAFAFLGKRLTLYPGRSLVQNIGNDSTGTHCATSDSFDVGLSETPVRVAEIPVIESSEARRAFASVFRDAHGPPNRLMSAARRVLGPGQVVLLRRLLRSLRR